MPANQFQKTRDEDIQKMLVCKAHLGTKNIDARMKHYTYKRGAGGVHIISLDKTWEKIQVQERDIDISKKHILKNCKFCSSEKNFAFYIFFLFSHSECLSFIEVLDF